jgi:16S rRNA (cytosine1402-N4)-methyltransferase
MEALDPARGGVFVDCTAGGGGHSLAIARLLPPGSRLICLDRDGAALEACRTRLAEYADRVTLIRSNFSAVGAALESVGISEIDGVLWDLGVSSYQLDERSRGFSYAAEAPLDMRMDVSGGETAADVIQTRSEEELTRILREYGEERFAARIAHRICEAREQAPIETTLELAEIAASAIPAKERRREAQHPARRTFQAVRIEVNGELDAIAPSLRAAAERMNPGGRLAVITFHSLEDRVVKDVFRELSTGCTCPPEFPVCVCGKKPEAELITRKPILPSEDEIRINPRARSAKLRAAKKL